MALRYILVFFLLSCSSIVMGQKIHGRLQHEKLDVSNIHVLNTTTQKVTISDKTGYFSITARLFDTLVISSIQFKRKIIPVNKSVLKSTLLSIEMEQSTIELDEVVLRPFDLSGELIQDVEGMDIGQIINEATLELPNANVGIRTKNERLLYTARTWDLKVISVKLDPIINALSGRTLMLKKRVAQDIKEAKYNAVYENIPDSLVINGLKIPKNKLYQFYYFCEADKTFDSIVDQNIQGDIWKYMVQKSMDYRNLIK